MKLQRSTGILLAVAIALAATVAIIETRKGTPSADGETLYDFTETDVSSFSIELEDERLAFAKTDDTWQMTEPDAAPADPSSIAFLLNIITSDLIQETIVVNPSQLETYGLDQPTATIELTVDEESYTLTVGDEDFSDTSLYVMTAQDVATADSVDVYLMPKRLEDGLKRPEEEWLLANSEENGTVEGGDDSEEVLQDEENGTFGGSDDSEGVLQDENSPDKSE
ncbi:DUF4340 domain-containing protein [Leptothoe sp. PORK10 BA2]|uniref:DUF4340 domain-containing protein n=1 Tax=Leptothoe sp. PORK10 BA2 TaxID=3110254 RepID=UPI002B1EE77D|nr:DUF4340 domain-containing protein [Leptothoe sp. PORK10 BA2]MEA5462818.1 DUF4340 domain-containing protein [Leptothoe sp. PORK10 BA2]